MSTAVLPTLRTPRLTLRPLTTQDADAIVDGVGNYDVSRWLGVVPYPYDKADADAFIARQIEAGGPVWAICDEARLVGVVSLVDELGYWLARPVWGKGYGFEAARAVTAWWFEEPNRVDLVSGYFSGNDRSRGVLQALGFEERGLEKRWSKSLNQEVTCHVMHLQHDVWEARQDFILRTKRLVLRPLVEADADAFAAMMVPEITSNLARHKTGMTREEVLAELPHRTWQGYLGFTLAIERDGRMIGTVGIGGAPVGVGYFLAPEHWGQGYMTEALGAFLHGVFARFPLARVHADHFEDNPASGAVMRKLGFIETGRKLGNSVARLEPAPLITYALERDKLRVPE